MNLTLYSFIVPAMMLLALSLGGCAGNKTDAKSGNPAESSPETARNDSAGQTPSDFLSPAPKQAGLQISGVPQNPSQDDGSSSGPALTGLLVPGASVPFASHNFYKPLPLKGDPGLQYAVLAGGCFWCLEAVYELVPGVVDVVSGYTGGTVSRPTYEQVSMGTTGHAEAVRIAFDPAKVGYSTLLDYFWKIHDPTSLNRQGYDVGTQYRSAIFYVTEEQRTIATASIDRQKSHWANPIVTQLLPAGDFWIAEEYHQDYFRLNPGNGYCAAVISPKIDKSGLREK